MRTSKTKDRLCFDTINSDGGCMRLKTMRTFGMRWKRRDYLALAVEVNREAQEAILGIRSEMMHQGSSRTLQIGRFLQQREHRCPRE